jgi:hypothetical protein
MPHLEDRSMASRAVWHSRLRPDQADCHRACLALTTAGLQVLDGWHSSRHGVTARRDVAKFGGPVHAIMAMTNWRVNGSIGRQPARSGMRIQAANLREFMGEFWR